MRKCYIKNKETGEIRYVTSRSSDGTIETIEGSGTILKIKAKDNDNPWYSVPEGWEIVQYNYKELIPHIIDFCNKSEHARDIFDILARRLDDDYFQPGVAVRFVDNYYFQGDSRYTPYYSDCRAYVIKKIVPKGDRYNEEDETVIYEIILSPIGREDDYVAFRIPLYVDRLVEHDAYHSLQRFDKSY